MANFIQCGTFKLASLVYSSNNWDFMVCILYNDIYICIYIYYAYIYSIYLSIVMYIYILRYYMLLYYIYS